MNTRSVALIAIAVVLAGCESSGGRSGDGAAESRGHVERAAHALYQGFHDTSARSVDLLDWGYEACGTGTSRLSYGISMRLFAVAADSNTDFGAFRRRAVRIVRGGGWTLRAQPPTRDVTLPDVPTSIYLLTRRDGNDSLTGKLALVVDPKPSVGVSGTLTVNGPCVDVGKAAPRLQSESVAAPFPSPEPSASRS